MKQPLKRRQNGKRINITIGIIAIFPARTKNSAIDRAVEVGCKAL